MAITFDQLWLAFQRIQNNDAVLTQRCDALEKRVAELEAKLKEKQ